MTIDSSSLLGDPGAFAVSTHRAWIGRKEANLRRRTLDCGCPTTGEVFFHLWCDRLACREHADAEHDCGEFKGKSSSEEESVPAEAVVDGTDDRSGMCCSTCGRWVHSVTDWNAAEQVCRSCVGQPLRHHEECGCVSCVTSAHCSAMRAPVTEDPGPVPRPSFTLADMEEASAAVRARREREPQPVRHGFSTTHWGGITGWRTICCCLQGFGEESWHAHAHEHGVDPHGRHLDDAPCPCLIRCEQAPAPVDEHECGNCGAVDPASCAFNDAPPVDAALEPDQLLADIVTAFEIADRPLTAPVPWWRRMLGGGTR